MAPTTITSHVSGPGHLTNREHERAADGMPVGGDDAIGENMRPLPKVRWQGNLDRFVRGFERDVVPVMPVAVDQFNHDR
jgi:hypothetical protein